MLKTIKCLSVLVLGMVCACSAALAQTGTATGRVIDGEGLGIPGASVVLKGSLQGAATDIDGKFSIPNVSNGTTLVVSSVGYSSKEVTWEGQSLEVVLTEGTEELDEVVVTAMGISRSQKTLGYSATTVKNEELTVSRNSNVTNALSGKVAGLQVQSTSTDPGAANSITIRGFGSINGSNQPLYVVDGVPLQTTSFTTQGHAIAGSGISNIANEDIESLTVLKGAAATALYGSRAANGVIIITTKSGKKSGDRNFSIDYNGGVQFRQVSVLPMLQNKFGQGWNGEQTFIENGSWGPEMNGSLQVYGPIWNGQQKIHYYSPLENNVKEFFELGVSQNHTVALSGATNNDEMNYYLSYSHTGDDGIMPSNADKYTRNTLSFRNSFKAASWLTLSSSVNFARSATDVVGSYQGTSVIDGLYEFPRDLSLLDLRDLNSPFNTPEAYLTPYGITNPYWAIANNYNHMDNKQLYGKVQVDIKPIQQLTLSYRMGFDYADYDRKIGDPRINLDDALIDDNMGYAPKNMNQDGAVSAAYGRSYETNHDFLANFSDKFVNSKLDLNVNVGVNINERASTGLSGTVDVLTFETGFWQLSNGATKSDLSEAQSKRRLVGLFGDVTVGWADMVFLNVTARNDWSSTLPIGNNSFFYPGVTASWIFTELLPRNNAFTFGKVRLAWGKTGNDATPYRTMTQYVQAYANGYYAGDIVKFPFNGVNSFQASNTLGSSTLRPEMTTEQEAGLDLQFFHGRLGLDLAFYNRVTSDQIFTLPIDPATGYTSMVTNFGKVQNKGFEVLLNTTPVQTKKVRWDLAFNFSKNYNKVLSMPESLDEGKVNIYSFSAGDDAVYMYALQGSPIGQYYTYQPVITESGQPVVDANGYPLKEKDVTDTGMNMNHLWTGGATTSLSFYGFTLAATLDVRYGGWMFSRTKNLMQFTGNGVITTYNDRRPFVIPNSVYEDGSENVTPIYQTNGSYQSYFDKYGAGQAGLFYMMDRTFAKLRNVSLTWNVPKNWVRSMKLSDLSLTAFCNNAFVWTTKDNYYIDPESTTTGSDLSGAFGELYSNPSCRVWGLNLNVKF